MLAVDSATVGGLLGSSQGILLVREHGSTDAPVGEHFLLSMLEPLATQGVKYIFIEDLSASIEALKRITALPESAKKAYSVSFPLKIQLLQKIIEQARTKGITVQGVDADFEEPDLYKRIALRDDYIAGQIKAIAKGQRYIMIAGLLHAHGLKERLGSLSVCSILIAQDRSVISGDSVKMEIQEYFAKHMRDMRSAGMPVDSDRDKAVYLQVQTAVDHAIHWSLAKPSAPAFSSHAPTAPPAPATITSSTAASALSRESTHSSFKSTCLAFGAAVLVPAAAWAIKNWLESATSPERPAK